MGFIKIPNFDTLFNALWVKQISRAGPFLVVRAIHPIAAIGGGFEEKDRQFDYGDEDLSKAAFDSLTQELETRARKPRTPDPSEQAKQE